MRDSLNRIQGNDLGAGWIDHHTDLLLLFALLYGMVNLSDLPIVERRRVSDTLGLRFLHSTLPLVLMGIHNLVTSAIWIEVIVFTLLYTCDLPLL